MDDARIDEIFAGYGLSEREGKVYRALLLQGAAPAATVAQRAGIGRSNAYAALASLQHKGLVFSERRGAQQFYYSDNLQFFAAELNDRYNDLARLQKETRQLVREIELRGVRQASIPSISEFNGLGGLRTAYTMLLEFATVDGQIIAIVPNGFDASPLAALGDWFISQRTARGIKLLCLEPEKTFDEVSKADLASLRETEIVSDSIASSNCLIETSNSLLLLAYIFGEQIYTLVIRHRDLNRLLFELLHYVWLSHRSKRLALSVFASQNAGDGS